MKGRNRQARLIDRDVVPVGRGGSRSRRQVRDFYARLRFVEWAEAVGLTVSTDNGTPDGGPWRILPSEAGSGRRGCV